MAEKMVRAKTTFFQMKSLPKVLRRSGFKPTSGQPPSSIPAGQINLQK